MLDLIIKNAIVVTASDEFESEIGIKDGKILVLAPRLEGNEDCQIIDAEGGYVTVCSNCVRLYSQNLKADCHCHQPGGIDSHVHIAQSAAKALGAKSADNWTSATASALGGGTTSVIAFAVQNKGSSMIEAVEAYHREPN